MHIVAALLLVLLALAHSFLGEKYILIRLFKRGDLPKLFGGDFFTKATLRFVWHLLTVAWLGIAMLVLVALGPSHDPDLVRHILGWISIISAALPLYFTRGKHLSWVVLIVVGLLILLSRGA